MTVKEFWENNHVNENNDMEVLGHQCKWWLTDEPFEDLHTKELLKKDMNIIVVGVGTGRDIIELKKITDNIMVCDISETAIKKMVDTGIAKDGYTPEYYWQIETGKYDLIISHLVAQHMDNDELEHQISMLLPCLKKESGVFAMQFAADKNYNNTNDKEITEKMKMCGSITRSLGFMERLIERHGRIISRSEPKIFEYNDTVVWYSIKFTRSQDE